MQLTKNFKRILRPLFEGHDISAYVSNLERPRVLLTFTHWNKRAPISHGLAEAADMGFVGFIAHKNHWWQTEEFPAAIEKVLSEISDGCEITTFGSSMGGAGALLAAQFLPVATVLAAAPPIIVDHSQVPWELRFPGVQELVATRFELAPNLNASTKTYVMYDPFYAPDVRHLSLLTEVGRPFSRWPVPCSGHVPLQELAKAGLYRDFTTAFFVDRDPDLAWRIARNSRHRRGMLVLRNAQKRIFGRACRRDPQYIEALDNMIEQYGMQIEFLLERGLCLVAQGRPAKAVADFENCFRIEPRRKFSMLASSAKEQANSKEGAS